MTGSPTVKPSPADMARPKPETTPTGVSRGGALFEYAYMGHVRSAEARRAGSGEQDYLDRLANLASAENWDGSDARHPDEKRILRNYVHHTFDRAEKQGRISVSGDGGNSAFNTGLATPQQETVYGLFQRNSVPGRQSWRFHGWRVESDRAMLDLFSPLPNFVSYTDDPTDYIFDWRRELKVNVRHIAEDNLDRFSCGLAISAVPAE